MPDKGDVIAVLRGSEGKPLSLAVGRQAGEDIEARRLLLGEEVAGAFAEQGIAVNDRIEDAEVVPYTANAELNDGQVFLIEDDATLDELSAFTTFTDDLGGIQAIAPEDLDLRVKFYAVAIGDDGPVVYVKRTNPQVAHKPGRFFAVARERLTRVAEPDFEFSSDFDFVVGPDWVVVVSQKSFEMLFRDVNLVQQHVDSWIEGVTDHLPMAPPSLEVLREVALKDSRLWRRLKEIKARGHLANVSLNDVRTYAEAMELDPAKVVVNNELVFDPKERFSFLQLLNEDIYKGELTKTVFESQRKAAADS